MKNVTKGELATLLRNTHWTADVDREDQAAALLEALKDEPVAAPAVVEAAVEPEKPAKKK